MCVCIQMQCKMLKTYSTLSNHPPLPQLPDPWPCTATAAETPRRAARAPGRSWQLLKGPRDLGRSRDLGTGQHLISRSKKVGF